MFLQSRLKSLKSKVVSFDFVFACRSWFRHFRKIFGPSENPIKQLFSKRSQETSPPGLFLTLTSTDCHSLVHWLLSIVSLSRHRFIGFTHFVDSFAACCAACIIFSFECLILVELIACDKRSFEMVKTVSS